MSRRSDGDLDRLLARGKLSGPDRERILHRVLRQTPGAPSGRFRARLVAYASTVAAVTAIVVAVVWTSLDTESQEMFRVKGAGNGAVVEIGCRHGDTVHLDRCGRGDNLLLKVDGLEQEVYLAAYSDGPDGQRVWYFPEDDGSMPRIGPTPGPVLVNRSVILGDEHAAGRHRITVVLLPSKTAREAVLSSEPVSVWSFELEVAP